MSEQCKPCAPSALETSLLALDLQAIDSEVIRVDNLVKEQSCKIQALEEEKCKLELCLTECKETNRILAERTRGTLGKLRGIQTACR